MAKAKRRVTAKTAGAKTATIRGPKRYVRAVIETSDRPDAGFAIEPGATAMIKDRDGVMWTARNNEWGRQRAVYRVLPTKPAELKLFAQGLLQEIDKIDAHRLELIEQSHRADHYQRINKQQARKIVDLSRRLDHARFLAIDLFSSDADIDAGSGVNRATPERDSDGE